MADGEAAYMDDELGDLDDVIDDDDDDAPLLPPGGRGKAVAGSAKATAGPSAGGPSSAAVDKLPLNPATHRKYTLHVAAASAADVVVARFRDAPPDLPAPGAGSVRLYREGEESVAARIAACRAGERQTKYFNSYSGRLRGEHNKLVGITTVPDRVKRKWNLELFSERDLAAAPHAALERAKRAAAAAAAAVGGGGDSKAEAPAAGADAAAAGAAGGVPPAVGVPALERHTRRGPLPYAAYTGQFEGEQAGAHYAYLVVDDDTRTAEIVPLGPHARYLFRQRHGAGTRTRTVEEAEQAMKARESAGGKRLDRLMKSFEATREGEDTALGVSRVSVKAEAGGGGGGGGGGGRGGGGGGGGGADRADTSAFSIRRTAATMARGKDEEEERHVGLDYKETFDDDDLAQVEEPELADRGDDEEEEDVDEASNMDSLRRMIKDEPLAERAGSPGPRAGSPNFDGDSADEDGAEEGDEDEEEGEGEDGDGTSAAATPAGDEAPAGGAAGADKTRRRRSASVASDGAPAAAAAAAAARRGRSPSPAPAGERRGTPASGGAAKRRSSSPAIGDGVGSSRGVTPVPAKRAKKEASPAPSWGTPPVDAGGGGDRGGSGTPRPSPPPPDRPVEFAHLVPAAGVAITQAHFVDILLFMEGVGRRLQLKELLAKFDLSTADKKKRVWDIVRKIATITRDATDTKAHYLSLKDAFRPPPA